MKVLIIEDERRAANHLERLIKLVAPEMEIIGILETVRDAIAFLEEHQPALIFSDMQLADGLSFEIYKQVKIACPIIFTTAYDQYAIEAFKTNGIDYLLKPIEEERLDKAIKKVKQFSSHLNIDSLLSLASQAKPTQYKTRFMVKVGDKIKSISISEIQAFYSYEKASYLFTIGKRSYPIDYSLDELYDLLNEDVFFKINRKYIVSIDSCVTIIAYSNSRLKISIDGLDEEPIIVAREKVQEFKKWLDR